LVAPGSGGRRKAMRFQVTRSSEGNVSRTPPCPEAVRGPEAAAFPGEYLWFVELNSIEDLVRLLDTHGGLVLWSAEQGEGFPVVEILDEEDEDEE
jgi:hypothetical protein